MDTSGRIFVALNRWLEKIRNFDSPFPWLLISIFFFIDKVVLGPYASIQLRHFQLDYNYTSQIGRLLFKYGFYGWDPTRSGGMPAYANHLSPVHVYSLLEGIGISPWMLYSVLSVLAVMIAGWGMFRLLINSFYVRPMLAAVGGVIFAVGTQIVDEPFPVKVFIYGFPMFFDFLTGRHGISRIAALIFINLLFLISYPVITLPYYSVIHCLFFLALYYGRIPVKRIFHGAFLIVLLWTAYMFSKSTTLYALFEMVPHVSRIYPVEKMTVSAALLDFVAVFFRFQYSYSVQTGLLPFLAGAYFLTIVYAIQGILPGKLVRVQITWFGFLLFAALTCSKVKYLFAGTWIEKSDLHHSIWMIGMFIFMVAVVAFNSLLSSTERIKKWFFLVAFASLAALVAFYVLMPLPASDKFTVIRVRLFAVTLNSAVLFAAILYCYGRGVVTARLVLLLKWTLTCGFLAALAALLYHYRERTFIYPVFVATALVVLYLAALFRKETVTAVICILLVVFVFSARLMRFSCIFSEDIPYGPKAASYRAVADHLKKNTAPFRVVSLSGPEPWFLWANGIETADGVSAIFFKHYKDLVRIAVRDQITQNDSQKAFDNEWYRLYFDSHNKDSDLVLKDVSDRIDYNLLRLFGVTSIISTNKSEYLLRESERMSLLSVKTSDGKPVYIYDLKNPLPRVFFAGLRRVYDNDAALLRAFGDSKNIDFRHEVLLSRDTSGVDVDIHDKPGMGGGKAVLRIYEPDRMVVDVETNNPGILVVLNNYYKGWSARIDGALAPLLRVNHAFQGVDIPVAGRHSVELLFDTGRIKLLHLVELIAIVIMNLVMIALSGIVQVRRHI
ncbi:MAG: hypothetical protein A2583_14375 [Bdellovibrionales bacterium RIFOXYD1_FULL_53_11]|nr:MAG: hypothetical protein A2583_14375 [Bdellovibrionales bacterium RIFOXYD1_FULL_53_11]